MYTATNIVLERIRSLQVRKKNQLLNTSRYLIPITYVTLRYSEISNIKLNWKTALPFPIPNISRVT